MPHPDLDLIDPACESYRTNCGPKAIELAKHDLLGRLIELAEAVVGGYDSAHPAAFRLLAQQARAIINELPPSDGP